MKKSYVNDVYNRCTAELVDDTASHEPARYPEYYISLTISPIQHHPAYMADQTLNGVFTMSYRMAHNTETAKTNT